MGKRVFDILGASSALILLSPLLVAIAVWIRMDSPGTIFFRQERVGRNGVLFRIYKFRTMISDAPAKGGELTVMADPRITKCGKWLRRTKLDELPQFINVLIGAMSLVGPRPEVPRYVAKYPPEMRHIVLSVRPGITDMASIKFRNESALLSNSSDPEATYLEEILPIKLGYYVDYVHKRSIVLDVKILYWTVLAVFGEK